MTIKLLYNSIILDVRQLTYRYGEQRYSNDGSQSEIKDLSQVGDNQSDNDLIMRYCHTGVGKLKMKLKDYLSKSSSDANDELTHDGSWSFQFTSSNYDSQALANLMHWFVVRFAMYEWTKAFSPSESSIAKSDLDDLYDDLDDLVAGSWPKKERRTIEEEISEIEIVL